MTPQASEKLQAEFSILNSEFSISTHPYHKEEGRVGGLASGFTSGYAVALFVFSS